MEHNILDELIIGRVEPNIYAFTTETIPNYLKVGDTYRPVLQRINEWKRVFPNLEHIFHSVASVGEETYFRDYSIHRFLETERERLRLQADDISDCCYYSNEFFKDATAEDVKDAIEDIRSSYDSKDGRYKFFSLTEGRVPVKITYERNQNFEPRPNQQETIALFKNALQKGRSNLLMYAVMRFGKSFTSMCCALEMEARLVLVVSAKADVKNEWKRTVESHVKFRDYLFLDCKDLMGGINVLSYTLQQNRVVVFLTLQDLMGDEIKEKHKEIFESQIDLLLIDETHYGARATEYGKVLNLTQAELVRELRGADTAEYYEDNDTLKSLDACVRIHLSGTPYRILMGIEFEKEDIIAFYQFSDIMRDQAEWNEKYILSDEFNEWDNPYYGFPQMIRFAFNPNQSTLDLYRKLEEMGVNTALSEVFRPKRLKKDRESNSHKEFVHKKEVLDFLKTIDGKKKTLMFFPFLT